MVAETMSLVASTSPSTVDGVIRAAYESYRIELYGYLVRMTRDKEAAEDLLHETFIRLVREARAGRFPDLVRPWLFRVATNVATSRARNRAVWTRVAPRLIDRGNAVAAETEALRAERDTELRAALATLSLEARSALLLAAHGYPGREIAASIGRTEGATRTFLSRSRMLLREALESAELSA
jgi:RNA polymerase sigma-70 factor, ECF subfamily